MANIYDLLSGVTSGAPSESDMLAADPYFSSGRQIAQIQAKPTTNTEAILGPMLQGLLSGGLMGYGRQDVRQQEWDTTRSNPLLSALSGQQQNPLGPGIDGPLTQDQTNQAALHDYSQANVPDGWKPETSRSDLIMAALAKQTADEEAVKKQAMRDEIAKTVLGEAVKSGDISPQAALTAVSGDKIDLSGIGSGDSSSNPRLAELKKIYGIDDPNNVINTNSKLQKYLEHNPDENKTKLEDAQQKRWLADPNYKTISEIAPILPIMDKLSTQDSPIANLALQELVQTVQRPGNAIRGEIFSRMADARNPANVAAGAFNKLFGGGVLTAEDKAQIIPVIKDIAISKINDAKNIADGYKSIADNRGLNFGNIIPNYDTLFAGATNPGGAGGGAPPAPPPGYELTGSVDASGNYGIRRVR